MASRLGRLTLWIAPLVSVALVAVAVGQFVPAGLRREKPKQVSAPENEVVLKPRRAEVTERFVASKVQVADAYDEKSTRFSKRDISRWEALDVDGERYRVSPVVSFGRYELNHHRVQVNYSGNGSVQLMVIYFADDNLAKAVSNAAYHSVAMRVKSGQEVSVSSFRRGDRCVWLAIRTVGAVTIESAEHTCWRGKDTLYGHVAREFEFAGATLRYRLMMPRNYDPKKSYPLVVNVHGSGGVGSGNVKNMENVILAKALLTTYYYDEAFECFSIVPQITPVNELPAAYGPNGSQGMPTRAHPDWPLVNERGWYTQASLALVRAMLADDAFNIDASRVYFAGFSYGGKACWEFLKAAPDMFAAAMCGAGWPIGPAFSKPEGWYLTALKREVQRYKDVPVFIFAGEQDAMRLGSRAVHEEILAQGGVSTYVEFPKTSHVGSSKAWRNREYISWLFQQKRADREP